LALEFELAFVLSRKKNTVIMKNESRRYAAKQRLIFSEGIGMIFYLNLSVLALAVSL
jgi:hypothetical protein